MSVTPKPLVLIDTKNACFVCLKECSEDNLNKLFSFRTLSQYLKINLEKTLRTSCSYQTILLCEDCYDEAHKFSKLYRELEVTKMLIYSSLEKIHAKMIDAEAQGSVSVGQSGLVEDIRRQMIAKCELKVRKIVPKVAVQKLNGGPPSAPTSSSSSWDTSYSEAVEFESLPVETVIKEEAQIMPSHSWTPLVEPVPFLNNDTSTLTESSAATATDLSCEHCNKSFSDSTLVHDHQIGSHADQLFKYYKHHALSHLQFRLALERFLFENENAKHSSNQMLKTSSCEFCPFPVSQSKRFCLRRHLVDEHFEIMAERLVHFQEENLEHLKGLNSENPKELFHYMFQLVEDGGGGATKKTLYRCNLCASSMTEYWRRDHLSSHGYCVCKCRFCEETFCRTQSTKSHELGEHSEIILESLNIDPVHIPKDLFKRTLFATLDLILCLRSDPQKESKCPLCPKVKLSRKTTKIAWRRHMLIKHFEYTAKRIIEAQFPLLNDRVVKMKCRHCGERFNDKASFRTHLDNHITVPPELCPLAGGAVAIYVKTNCDKCGALITTGQLAAHQKSHQCKINRLQLHSKVKVKDTIQIIRNRNEGVEVITVEDRTRKRGSDARCDLCGVMMTRGSLARHRRMYCPMRSSNPKSGISYSQEEVDAIRAFENESLQCSSSFVGGNNAPMAESEVVFVGGGNTEMYEVEDEEMVMDNPFP